MFVLRGFCACGCALVRYVFLLRNFVCVVFFFGGLFLRIGLCTDVSRATKEKMLECMCLPVSVCVSVVDCGSAIYINIHHVRTRTTQKKRANKQPNTLSNPQNHRHTHAKT